MTRILNWLTRNRPDPTEEREQERQELEALKREIAEVVTKAEERRDEQKRHTQKAVRDNPLAYRIRARPAGYPGGRDVFEK